MRQVLRVEFHPSFGSSPLDIYGVQDADVMQNGTLRVTTDHPSVILLAPGVWAATTTQKEEER